jgi:hypothetical protein
MLRAESFGGMGRKLRVEYPGAKAERIIAEELRRRQWTETNLAIARKGDPDKIEIAQRLHRQTTMTLTWIANRLQMGTRTHLDHLLNRQNRQSIG